MPPLAGCEQQAEGTEDDTEHRNVTDTGDDAKETPTEAACGTNYTEHVLADLGVPFARELTEAASYAAEFVMWLIRQFADAVAGLFDAITEGSRAAGERIVADAPIVASAAAKHATNARHAAEESYHRVVHTVAPVAVRTTTDVAEVIGDTLVYLAKLWGQAAGFVYEEMRAAAGAVASGLERAARGASCGAGKASREASRWVHNRKREIADHVRTRYHKRQFELFTCACAGHSNTGRENARSVWTQMLEWPHVRAAHRNARRLSNAARTRAKGPSKHDANSRLSANRKFCGSSCSSHSNGRRSGNNNGRRR